MLTAEKFTFHNNIAQSSISVPCSLKRPWFPFPSEMFSNFESLRRRRRELEQQREGNEREQSRHEEQEREEEVEKEDEAEDDLTFLSLFYGRQRLGAALFNLGTGSLQVLEDVEDQPQEMKMLKMLLFQTNPRHVLVSQKQTQTVKDMVKVICGGKREEQEREEEEEEEMSETETNSRRTTLTSKAGGQETDHRSGSDPSSSIRSRRNDTDPTVISLNNSQDQETTVTGDMCLRNTELTFLPGKDFSFPHGRMRITNLRLPQELGSAKERILM